jgi:hypothetical protein
MRRYLAFSPRFEDDDILIFHTQPEAERDFFMMKELAPGIGPVDFILTTTCVRPGQHIELDIAWGTSAAQSNIYNARLALLDKAGREVQNQVYPVDPDRPEILHPANALFWAFYPLQVAPNLVPGDYGLTLSLGTNEFGDAFNEAIPLGSLAVSENPCPTELPDQAQSAEALFGEEILLLGYEVQRASADRLDIILHWRAEQRMKTDYKIFVHIFDPNTGIPVAQDDAMPHRGGLPTRLWTPGELVTDIIPIEIGEVTPGKYGIAFGVYDPVTGERLPMQTIGGAMSDDGRYVTEEQIIIGSE